MKKHTILVASVFTALSGFAFAAGIPAQPIVTLDAKKVGDFDPSNFFLSQGPGKGGTVVPKLVFTTRVKSIPNKNLEQRAMFVQKLESEADPTTHYFQVNKTSPLTKIGTYTVATGTKFDSFIGTTDTAGDSKKPRYDQMFFHVPGRGLYVTEGGKAPKVVRSEKATDPTTEILAGALRLSDYVSSNTDITRQSRFFFTAKDPKKGREPFIYDGKAAKVLKDLDTTPKVGVDPTGFAALGPQLEPQRVFFVANNPADSNNPALWIVNVAPSANGKTTVYDPVVFADSSIIPGTIENLVANGSDLFFTAPKTAGGTPVLWHLAAGTNLSAANLENFPSTSNPQQLTFINEDSSYSDLAFTTFDSGEQRYARWSHTGNSVAILGTTAGLVGASQITPANDSFYFTAPTTAGGTTYLLKHSLADDSITYIESGTGNIASNVTEVCRVSNTIYFVGDGLINGKGASTLLWKLDNDSSGTFNKVASPVLTPAGAPVIYANDLHAIVAPGSGIFRLYFSAPIRKFENEEFRPADAAIDDYGYKPFVTAVDGN